MLGLGEGISGYYNVLLVLHILSAIIGLGSVMLNGLYLSQAQRRPGPAGRDREHLPDPRAADA